MCSLFSISIKNPLSLIAIIFFVIKGEKGGIADKGGNGVFRPFLAPPLVPAPRGQYYTFLPTPTQSHLPIHIAKKKKQPSLSPFFFFPLSPSLYAAHNKTKGENVGAVSFSFLQYNMNVSHKHNTQNFFFLFFCFAPFRPEREKFYYTINSLSKLNLQ